MVIIFSDDAAAAVAAEAVTILPQHRRGRHAAHVHGHHQHGRLVQLVLLVVIVAVGPEVSALKRVLQIVEGLLERRDHQPGGGDQDAIVDADLLVDSGQLRPVLVLGVVAVLPLLHDAASLHDDVVPVQLRVGQLRLEGALVEPQDFIVVGFGRCC